MKSVLLDAAIEFLSLDRDEPRWRTAVALVAANALLIAGVLVLHWPPGTVMFLYWAENVVVGGFTLLKMVTQAVRWDMRIPTSERLSIAFNGPFLFFHFGLFTGVHLVFLMPMANEVNGSDALPRALEAAFTSPSTWTWHDFVEGLWPPFLMSVASHGYSYWKHTVRAYSRKPISELFWEPYPRVAVMHLTVLGGFMLFTKLGWWGVPGPLLVLMVLKTVVDLASHVALHRGR
ncbi:MAG: DUF6498-containing protein [Myxococcaceae bacterium]|nr:DUF6498-containing protein [Myxococcaceae bacterium]